MAGARGQARGPGQRLIAASSGPDTPVSTKFPADFASLCRSHKIFTCRRKFEKEHRPPPALHDLPPRSPTGGRSGPLATSADRSELDQAEGHGGAETRGDPGIKADRPGSLIERTGGFDLNGRETGSRPKGPFKGFGRRRPEGTGSGSMDGAGLDLVERRRPGARQDTADHHRGSPR